MKFNVTYRFFFRVHVFLKLEVDNANPSMQKQTHAPTEFAVIYRLSSFDFTVHIFNGRLKSIQNFLSVTFWNIEIFQSKPKLKCFKVWPKIYEVWLQIYEINLSCSERSFWRTERTYRLYFVANIIERMKIHANFWDVS